ncbi:major intrinsically disordered Notch2-binding receptor 1 [Cololabis saira]|uniref:major intrinsically disordered Notch2-binding receptor 1 n=1 Tax=Cololabis saira TaxID=129043 RepID=UPI002AD56316|nr:major intrinsically disordered Notch2-binding receptor 1 [Cololabis saira]
MDPACSQFLARLLQELDPPSTSSSRMTFPDLCTSLCARFDLLHLLKIHSLLFQTASMDPAFPVTLFQDRMCSSSSCSEEDGPQKKKLMVAADIVAMLNLIQMGGEELAPKLHRPGHRKDGDGDGGVTYDRFSNKDQHQLGPPPAGSSCDCHALIHTSDPNFLLKRGAPPQDQLQDLPQKSVCPPPPDLRRSYFPSDADSESVTDQESLQTVVPPDSVQSCGHRRNVFKQEHQHLLDVSPQVITRDVKQTSKDALRKRDMHKPATFFNHSFELPYSNPYFEPEVHFPPQDRLRVKHESLDDLQASTYFGPTTSTDHVTLRKYGNRAGKPSAWPVKSLSLNTEEAPPAFQRPFLKTKALQQSPSCSIRVINTDDELQFRHLKDKGVESPGIVKRVAVMAKPDRRLKDKSPMGASFQGGDCTSSVGTQTEQGNQKKARDLPSKFKDRERHQLKHSEEDSDVISESISDIFRFLDDMSVCDSLGIIQSSGHNSTASLSQGTLKSDNSSPEHSTVKLAKSKLDRLFQSLESSDDELKLSVCKLVMRIGEIEKKLESLSGVRSEISEVLLKLNKLDEKIQEPKVPEARERQQSRTAASASISAPEELPPHANSSLPAHVFQCHTTGHNRKWDFGLAGEQACPDRADKADGLRMKALKRSLFTARSSRSLNEENSATESKVASITNSPCDWRAVPHPHIPPDNSMDGDREPQSKASDRRRKAKQVERDHHYELSHPQRPPKPAAQSYVMEDVFSPHPFSPSIQAQTKDRLLDANLRLSVLSDGKHSQSFWTAQGCRSSPGDKGNPVQTQESLNPNNLEYWMEDVYTPGFDSLLKRKEAEFKRVKACKIGALIAAAACTVVLVIVVPICTLKS